MIFKKYGYAWLTLGFFLVSFVLQIGSYPFFKQGRVGSNFVVRSENAQQAKAVADGLAGKLADAGYEPVAGGI